MTPETIPTLIHMLEPMINGKGFRQFLKESELPVEVDIQPHVPLPFESGDASFAIALVKKGGTMNNRQDCIIGPMITRWSALEIQKWRNTGEVTEFEKSVKGTLYAFFHSVMGYAMVGLHDSPPKKKAELLEEKEMIEALKNAPITRVPAELSFWDRAYIAAMQALVTTLQSFTDSQAEEQLVEWRKTDPTVKALADGCASQARAITKSMIKYRIQ